MGENKIKKWFTIKEVFPHIWGIGEFNHPEKVISYLCVGKKKALLFDTGMGIESILDTAKKITPLPICILNSHCHPDHMGGNWLFNDILFYKTAFGLKKAKRGYSFKETLSYFNVNKPFSVKSFSIKKIVTNGEIIDIAPFHFQVIATPGHTPDSLCLYEKRYKLLFTGDTLYQGPIYIFLKESRPTAYRRSIEELSKLNISLILPGHNTFSLKKEALIHVRKSLENDGNNTNRQVTKEISLLFRI